LANKNGYVKKVWVELRKDQQGGGMEDSPRRERISRNEKGNGLGTLTDDTWQPPQRRKGENRIWFFGGEEI